MAEQLTGLRILSTDDGFDQVESELELPAKATAEATADFLENLCQKYEFLENAEKERILLLVQNLIRLDDADTDFRADTRALKTGTMVWYDVEGTRFTSTKDGQELPSLRVSSQIDRETFILLSPGDEIYSASGTMRRITKRTGVGYEYDEYRDGNYETPQRKDVPLDLRKQQNLKSIVAIAKAPVS